MKIVWSSMLWCALAGMLSHEARAEEGPIGWASVAGGTRGGAGGETITVEDAEAFLAAVESKSPAVVRFSGVLRLPRAARVGSHKSIEGMGGEARLEGAGLTLNGVENVILRNVTIRGADDAINLEKGTHHVWIDHCDLSACRDGLIDIKRGSDYVTVSWNHLHDHRKSCLLGHSDKEDIRRMDTGRLRVTYHHNFFDGTQTRHPRVRYADPVHVFNNYFRKNEYGVASVMDAGVLVEGNYFEDVEHPTHTQYGDSPDPGRLFARDNVLVRSGEPEVRGAVLDPGKYYRYTLDPAEQVAEQVRRGAGVGKMRAP
ncbi:MAG: right-handed parallel beta-helix repeat-containing protein [Pirellulaceae bacterium]